MHRLYLLLICGEYITDKKMYKYKRRACIVTSENRLYRLFLYNQLRCFSAFAAIVDSSMEVYILEEYKNEEYE